LVLGKQSDGPTQPLFDTTGADGDPTVARMYTHPPFVREFWCAMSELANTWMVPAVYSPLVDARYSAFRANDVPVDSPDGGVTVGAAGMTSWIAARRAFILSQIPVAAFNVTSTNFNSASNYITITGTAPVTAKDILINGGEYPITWTTVTAWSVRVPLTVTGTNTLVVTALDRAGNALGSRTNVVNYTGGAPDPSGTVVINEIMFNPPADETSFLELFNTHTNYTFDLGGWRMNGLSYTFPPGAVIPPRSFVVVGRNHGEYAKAYGAITPFFAQFDGALDNDGETLTLLRPGAMPGEEIIVDKVKYEGRAPWPEAARGGGSSIQLIDPAQDNARVSNWSDGTGWRFFSFTTNLNGTRLLLYFDAPGNVYLDDMALVAGTVSGVGTNYLVNGDFESSLAPAWRLQGTNGTNSASSPAAKLSGNAGLDLRFFPAGSASQYLYQDLSNVTVSATYTLSFWYLPLTSSGNIQFRVSSGFRGAVPVRPPSGPLAINATPGAANALTVPLQPYPLVWLNEVLSVNTTGLTDGQNEREPWIELYNSSAAPIPLDGLFLSDDYVNLTKWSFPAGSLLQPGQRKLVFADNEPGESTASEGHANFRLSAGTGSVALSRAVSGGSQIIDYLNFDNLGANHSYGSCPDGQLFDRREMFNPTPSLANNCAAAPLAVFINEWMAANTGFLRDPSDNDADDWFELYNPNAFTVDLGGSFLTDNLTNKFQFQVPSNGHYTIPALGYLLVWADGEPGQNSTNVADLHVNFSLRQAGEAIGLFAADGTLIDAVSFLEQTNNVSQGRSPDGGPDVVFLIMPTPRGANAGPTGPITAAIGISGNTVIITFNTTPGLRYRVDFKNDLNAPAWTELAPAQSATASLTTVFDLVNGMTQRFYRAVLVP
jgi:hypothetical protein